MSTELSLPQPTKAPRLLSLDVFRGITIAAMILVNNPGTWGAMYSPLAHAPWHGYTPTDLIFPFFLFIVGVAMAFSLARREGEAGSKRPVVMQIFRRAAIIFALGFATALLSYFLGRRGLPLPRIPGVLQRIALCYAAGALIALFFQTRGRVVWLVVLLLSYWLMMKFVPVPEFGAGKWDSSRGNLASYVDSLVLGPANYVRVGVPNGQEPTELDSMGNLITAINGSEKPEMRGLFHDPEGLLSSIPAIGTVLIGLLAGTWLRQRERDPNDRAMGMAAAGLFLIVLGYFWGLDFPLNKNLWTSSYTLVCGGWALLGLAVCYYIIDIKGYVAWSKPFHIFGVNAITAFVASGLLAIALGTIKVGSGENKVTLKALIYDGIYRPLFEGWGGREAASLAFAVSYVLLFLGLMYLLYRKNIIIKV